MYKVLIYRRSDSLTPSGGPNGYLYSLRKGLETIKNENIEIEFLPPQNYNKAKKNQIKSSNNVIVKKILDIYRTIKHIKFNLSVIDGKKTSPVKLNNYDAVHFHSTCDLHFLRDELSNYRGKVILTSHSPQPLAYEFIESSSSMEMKLFGEKYKRMIESDEYAFNRADYIIFPCEYSDEPYLNVWAKYSDIKMKSLSKYRYTLTGTVPATIRSARKDVREKYGIPQDAFVVCYVGRHNEIKGYDRFKDICETFLSENKNAYVIVAGNIGPLTPPNNKERWIEVGWTNDPHSIIAASNTFLLPNRETYFDLILLEVLSIGVPIIASNTGGNKYFNKYNFDGIKLFDSDEECKKQLKENLHLDIASIERIKKENMNLYLERFTTDAFAKGYLNTILGILEEE